MSFTSGEKVIFNDAGNLYRNYLIFCHETCWSKNYFIKHILQRKIYNLLKNKKKKKLSCYAITMLVSMLRSMTLLYTNISNDNNYN